MAILCSYSGLGPRARQSLPDRTGLETATAEATQSLARLKILDFCFVFFLFKKTTWAFVKSEWRTRPDRTPGGSELGRPRGPGSPLQQGSEGSARSQAAPPSRLTLAVPRSRLYGPSLLVCSVSPPLL